MTGNSWNYGALTALMNRHAEDLKAIWERHPEAQGCAMDVDPDTGAPFYKLIVYKENRRDVSDIPARVGTAADGLDIRVEFR